MSSKAHSSRLQKRFPLIGALLCVLSMLILIPASPAQAQPTPFTGINLVTWNSLGQNWSSVATLLSRGHGRENQLAVIQEAGPAPAEMQDFGVVAERTFGNVTYQVRRYRWEAPGATYQVYWMNGNAANGGRVNFAIVAREMALSVLIAPPPRPNTRPSFGIRIGLDYYFNVHAPSPNNGQDAVQILSNISNTVAAVDGLNWTAIGDFNVNPGALQPYINGAWPTVGRRPVIYQPGVPTQDGWGTLDYMVSSHSFPGLRMVRDGQIGSSDHYPVYNEFNLSGGGEEYYLRSNKYPNYTMQPNGSPYTGDSVVLGYPSSPFDEFVFSGSFSKAKAAGAGVAPALTTIKEADSGLCLDPLGYVSQVRAKLELYPCSGSVDQTFSTDPASAEGTGMKSMMIRHDLSGLCLSVFESSTSAEPTWIGLDNCNKNSINQRFSIIA